MIIVSNAMLEKLGSRMNAGIHYKNTTFTHFSEVFMFGISTVPRIIHYSS